MANLTLRAAGISDAKIVFEWRNDPYIVQRASTQSTVDWETHQRWYDDSLRRGHERLMFIVEDDHAPIGLVRFDRMQTDGCVISTYLLKEFTGKGFGVEAIRRGCNKIFSTWNVRYVRACIRSENANAQSAFAKANFVRENSSDCPDGHTAMVLRNEGSTSQ